MPLVPKEPDVFPEDLSFRPEDGPPWWVAHVRSRQEKVLARHLREGRIPYFFPQSKREITSGGRRRYAFLPLFSGYVFFRASRETLATVWRSNVVSNILEVEVQEGLAAELEQIHDLLKRGASLVAHEELTAGEAVRIQEGPFKGYTGIVVRYMNADRLIVSVSLIRKAVAVEFSRGVVRRAPGAHRER